MLSKTFMQYLSGLEKSEKEKSKKYSSDFFADTKPLFYIILKNNCENKKV